MYKQDKVEKELFLDTVMIFQGSKDSLQNITHKQGKFFFLSNGLSQSFENEIFEKGKGSLNYR